MSRPYSIHAEAARGTPIFDLLFSRELRRTWLISVCGRCARRKNREISTNKLLKTGIPYLNQMVGETRKRPEPLPGANPVDRSPSWSPIARGIADTRRGVGLGGRA